MNESCFFLKLVNPGTTNSIPYCQSFPKSWPGFVVVAPGAGLFHASMEKGDIIFVHDFVRVFGLLMVQPGSSSSS
jgi:hypothetical protein